MIDVAFSLVQRKKDKAVMYQSSVTKAQTRWLASRTFRIMIGRRQTRFGGVLSWLERQASEAGLALSKGDRHLLDGIARGARARQGEAFDPS
ncbi:hypothetical protein BDV97DRAFT_104948 [Delphinella strobiligena]|nr:hypothetical protein BDV97DRAFT_104948 [Delphinella strobiligena]